MKQEKKIILNGREISLKEFEQQKMVIFKTKGMQLLEVRPGEYKTRLLG